jgi:integrase
MKKTNPDHEPYGAGYILKRVGKKATTYLARVRKQGENKAQTFKTKKEAKEFIDKISNEIDSGINQDKKKFKKYTLAQIYQEYLDDNPDNSRNYRLKKMMKVFENTVLEDFTSVEFEKILKMFLNTPVPMQERKSATNKHKLYNANMVKDGSGKLVRRKYSESTVRKYYYDCKIVLDWHSRVHRYDFDPEPFKNVEKPQAWGNQKKRRLKDGELELIFKGIDTLRDNKEKAKLLVKFLSMTGFRVGETLLIQKKHVKLDTKIPADSYIFIPKENQKGGQTRKKIEDRSCAIRKEIYFMLKDEILPTLKSDEDFLFSEWTNGHAFYQRFKNACINVGIEDLSVHSLRSEGLCWYFENTRLTDLQIMEISGHLTPATLKGYVRLRPSNTGRKIWEGMD